MFRARPSCVNRRPLDTRRTHFTRGLRLVIGLVIYVITGSVWMLAGLGGPQITHYVGLVSDAPAALASVIVAAATARRTGHGALRTGWICLALALGMYFVGTSIGTISWL